MNIFYSDPNYFPSFQKFKAVRKKIVISLIILLNLVFLPIYCVEAGEPAKKNDHFYVDGKTISIPDNVKSAKVVIVPVGFKFQHRLDEEMLLDSGCTFLTTDPLHISSLISLLNNANITIKVVTKNDKFTEGDAWDDEPREGIYLTLNDSSELQFLFGTYYSDQYRVRGIFFKINIPDIEKHYVTGSPRLPKELVNWGFKTGKPTSKSTSAQGYCQTEFAETSLK